MHPCAKCGKPAGPEKWKTLCARCFTRQREAEEEHGLQAQLTRALEENAALSAAVRRLLAEQNDGIVPAARGIPRDKLRLLLQLCHPDKHNGSRAATEATQWLMEQKGDK